MRIRLLGREREVFTNEIFQSYTKLQIPVTITEEGIWVDFKSFMKNIKYLMTGPEGNS